MNHWCKYVTIHGVTEEKFRIQMCVRVHVQIASQLHLQSSTGTYLTTRQSFTEAGSFRDRHAFPCAWSDINRKPASH